MKRKNLGRVQIISYVVDMDNKKMVEYAKDLLFDIIDDAVMDYNLRPLIEVVPDPTAKESDIHSCLRIIE